MANKLLLNIINTYFPKKIGSISRSNGSILLIDLGNKIFHFKHDGIQYFKGELGITIYLCKWNLSQNGKIVLTDRDTNDDKYERVFSTLTNSNIIFIEELIPRRKLRLVFDNNFVLTLMENIAYYGYQENMFMGYIDDTWWLYSPHKRFHWEYPEKGMLLENKYMLEANKNN